MMMLFGPLPEAVIVRVQKEEEEETACFLASCSDEMARELSRKYCTVRRLCIVPACTTPLFLFTLVSFMSFSRMKLTSGVEGM